jgi:hypothetical protein
MHKPRRVRPTVEVLETRVQLSTIMLVDYPWNFVGPIPVGAYRIASPGTPTGSSPGGARPLLVTGMTLTPAAPVVGGNITANLSNNTTGATYSATSTVWTMTIAYTTGGSTYTTPALSIGAGSVLNTTLTASVPGTYTVTAVTSYTSFNPTVAPPSPTTTTATATVAAPNGVVKGGAINQPTNYPMAVQLVDQVQAGGNNVGSMMVGLAQEDIPGYSFNGGPPIEGTGGWYPGDEDGPSVQFNLTAGKIYDQVGPVSMTAAYWASLPIQPPPAPGAPPVTPAVTWTQNLQILWNMTSTNSTTGVSDDYPFTASLGSLNWSLYKINATKYVIQ